MRRSIVAAVSACALVMAGCGGGHTKASVAHAPRPTLATVKADTGKPCAPADFAMQCALPSQPLGANVANAFQFEGIRAAADNHLYGVDFAWGGPRSCAALKAIGAKFAWSYWSYDTSGKNWTLGLVNQLHACGIATAGGWETTAMRAYGFGVKAFSNGVSDAHEAARQAAADGNVTGAIPLAIDFDASGPEVLSYFQGAHSVLGSRTAAYGGYRPLLYLFQHGAVGHFNFQTYAWSSGLWLPASIAPLEQYLNGNTYDNDRAIAANFGQFPAPGATAAQLAKWYSAMVHSEAAYYAVGCKQPVLGTKRCGQFAWRVVHFGRLSLNGKKVQCFGPHALTGAYICQIVRPEVSVWSKARAASQRAALNLGCNGPVGFPRPVKSPVCNKLRQRVTFFNTKARTTFLEF